MTSILYHCRPEVGNRHARGIYRRSRIHTEVIEHRITNIVASLRGGAEIRNLPPSPFLPSLLPIYVHPDATHGPAVRIANRSAMCHLVRFDTYIDVVH